MGEIKLIIFDVYGVVLNGGYPTTCKWVAKKYKRDYEEVYEIIYKRYFNMAAERKITQKDAWADAVRELEIPMKWQELRKKHYSMFERNEKVIKLANSLSSGYKTLLLSKNTRSQFADTENMLKFKKSFVYVINTWEIRLPKASSKTMRYIMRKFRVKPEEIVYIDDQPENLAEARRMGINIILYKSFKQFRNDLDKLI